MKTSLLSRWVAALCWSGLVCATVSSLAAPVPTVRVEGSLFTVQKLDEGVTGFGNRKYLLGGVPTFMRGWQFTRLNGGERASLTATPESDGEIYFLSGAGKSKVRLTGWTLLETAQPYYTAGGQTKLAVYSQAAKAGVPVTIPQGNWSGSMLAAPAIKATIRPHKLDHSLVPGIVIDHIPASTRCYVGSPSIVKLPNGDYLASHDIFGAGSKMNQTIVLRSGDRGKTWAKIADIHGQWWSTLFVHRGHLYIIGPSGQGGRGVVRRSDDAGHTWTEPKDTKSGLILPNGKYHCAPMPVIEYQGRLWRAMEDLTEGGLQAFMMSVPVEADLLDAANWTFSTRVKSQTNWLNGVFQTWREGNAVVDRQGQMLDIIRVDTVCFPEKAAAIKITPDGKTASFDPATGFIDFPGGAKKFTIRFDPKSDLYWSLVSAGSKEFPPDRWPGRVRNDLSLVSSPDLKTWTVRKHLFHHPDVVGCGWQYVDWVFEDNDIIAASRTSYDDGIGGAHSFHDANYLTFHRIENFRQLPK